MDGPVTRESACTQVRERLRGVDVELDHDHARRLMYFSPHFWPGYARQVHRFGLSESECLSDRRGGGHGHEAENSPHILRREPAARQAVQAHDADHGSTDLQGKNEEGANPQRLQLRTERRFKHGSPDIRDEDRLGGANHILVRSIAKFELTLVDAQGDRV